MASGLNPQYAEHRIKVLVFFLERNITVPDHDTTLLDNWMKHKVLRFITDKDEVYQKVMKIYRMGLSKRGMFNMIHPVVVNVQSVTYYIDTTKELLSPEDSATVIDLVLSTQMRPAVKRGLPQFPLQIFESLVS